jgi:hypothetical protein
LASCFPLGRSVNNEGKSALGKRSPITRMVKNQIEKIGFVGIG